VNLSDLERLLTYLLHYSEPQKMEEIKAFFVVMNQDEEFMEIGERSDLFPPVRLFSAEANPESPEKAKSSVERVCRKVLE
jgi:hypothetical protein